MIVTVRRATNSAERVDSLNVLRRIGTSFSAYSTDHRGRFIPGYLEPDVQTELDIGAKLADGTVVAPQAAASWVWRLAPYADNDWILFFRDNLEASEETSLRSLETNGDLLTLSLRPRFGMNSIFVGGNSEGPAVTDPPWTPNAAATRLSEVKQPAQLILFGGTVAAQGGQLAADGSGWHELRAPFLDVEQWSVASTGEVVPAAGLDAGVPHARSDGRTAPIVHLDGHTEGAKIEDISIDMRRWSAFADSVNWRLTP